MLLPHRRRLATLAYWLLQLRHDQVAKIVEIGHGFSSGTCESGGIFITALATVLASTRKYRDELRVQLVLRVVALRQVIFKY